MFYSNQGGQMNKLGEWRHQKEDSTWSLGLALWLGATVQLSENWFTYAQYGYDWIADVAEVQVGPNRVAFDPSGMTCMDVEMPGMRE